VTTSFLLFVLVSVMNFWRRSSHWVWFPLPYMIVSPSLLISSWLFRCLYFTSPGSGQSQASKLQQWVNWRNFRSSGIISAWSPKTEDIEGPW